MGASANRGKAAASSIRLARGCKVASGRELGCDAALTLAHGLSRSLLGAWGQCLQSPGTVAQGSLLFQQAGLGGAGEARCLSGFEHG